MPAWQGKSKATPLGYRIFVGILRTSGVKPAYFLLRFVSLYYYFFSASSSRAILYFLRERLHYSRIGSLKKLYAVYYNFGQSLIDKVVIMAGIPNKFTFNFDGENWLHNMVKEGRGGLLLSAHIGNWEIAGHLLKRLNTTINIVLFDGEQEQIKAYLSSVTGAHSAKLIVIKNDLSHIYAISDALANNELVCMHADRFVEGNKTVTVDFLNEPAKLPLGPFALAATYSVPVSFVFAVKERPTHYHFFASEPAVYKERDKDAAIQKIVHSFVEEMEKKAKAWPTQWFNFYNFWR